MLHVIHCTTSVALQSCTPPILVSSRQLTAVLQGAVITDCLLAVLLPQSQKLGSWYPVILITVFNVTDMVGKNIPFCGITPKPPTLLGLSVLRVLFVPAFMVAGRYAADVALLMGALTVCLGFTNG